MNFELPEERPAIDIFELPDDERRELYQAADEAVTAVDMTPYEEAVMVLHHGFRGRPMLLIWPIRRTGPRPS